MPTRSSQAQEQEAHSSDARNSRMAAAQCMVSGTRSTPHVPFLYTSIFPSLAVVLRGNMSLIWNIKESIKPGRKVDVHAPVCTQMPPGSSDVTLTPFLNMYFR